MCIFSGRVQDVSATSIYCVDLGSEHATVYQMSATIDTELAMLLPVPVRLGSGEDALRFVNLEGYPKFFKDMEELFVDHSLLTFSPDAIWGSRGAKSILKVHDVGSYEASFVPSLTDLDRLDSRFKLPRSVFDLLPDYDTFGFAVFKLKAGTGRKDYHPMAFAYPPESGEHLFFPTVHVHDGEVEDMADYDHRLYFQHGGEFGPVGWMECFAKPSQYMNLNKSCGLVRPDDIVERKVLRGAFQNCDHVLVTEGGACSVSQRSTRV